ncbi:MAG: histidine phosphatase family protein [Clostridia bacterium]|nr:histidine phosphatase family protein [Clostridia bacterium]
MTTFLLVRHGQSEANLQDLFAGFSDFSLTDLGRKQAEKTADFIAQNFNVSAVYASDLRRAFATGKAIADKCGAPITAHAGLREINGGKWEGKVFDTLKTDDPDLWELWIHDFARARCPQGESVAQLQQRLLSALTEIAAAHPGQTVVLATHATPVRLLSGYCLDPSMATIERVPWATNASVTVITRDDGKMQLQDSSLDAHLNGVQTGFDEKMK